MFEKIKEMETYKNGSTIYLGPIQLPNPWKVPVNFREKNSLPRIILPEDTCEKK